MNPTDDTPTSPLPPESPPPAPRAAAPAAPGPAPATVAAALPAGLESGLERLAREVEILTNCHHPGVVALLKRNTNYHKSGMPYFDALEVRSVHDVAARTSALRCASRAGRMRTS